jgi:hypothetical protein
MNIAAHECCRWDASCSDRSGTTSATEVVPSSWARSGDSALLDLIRIAGEPDMPLEDRIVLLLLTLVSRHQGPATASRPESCIAVAVPYGGGPLY